MGTDTASAAAEPATTDLGAPQAPNEAVHLVNIPQQGTEHDAMQQRQPRPPRSNPILPSASSLDTSAYNSVVATPPSTAKRHVSDLISLTTTLMNERATQALAVQIPLRFPELAAVVDASLVVQALVVNGQEA